MYMKLRFFFRGGCFFVKPTDSLHFTKKRGSHCHYPKKANHLKVFSARALHLGTMLLNCWMILGSGDPKVGRNIPVTEEVGC